jgi:hypothetical protein
MLPLPLKQSGNHWQKYHISQLDRYILAHQFSRVNLKTLQQKVTDYILLLYPAASLPYMPAPVTLNQTLLVREAQYRGSCTN